MGQYQAMSHKPNILYFDITFLENTSGIGRDSRTLLNIFQSQIYLEVVLIDPLVYKFPHLKIINKGLLKSVKKLIYAISTLLNRPLKIKLPANSFYFQSQASTIVVTGDNVYQILRVHDLFPITNPEWFKWHTRRSFILGMRHVAKKHLFLCNSRTTLTSLEKTGFISLGDKEAIVLHCSPIIPPSKFCGVCNYCTSGSHPRRYFLALSTIEPRKNYEFILNAWREQNGTRNDKLGKYLIIVGKLGWKSKGLKKMLQSEHHSNIIWIPKCCDQGVRELLKNSIALISASFNEGYNLPPGEALLAGTSIILSDIQIHRERYGGWAKFFPLQENLVLKNFLKEELKISTEDVEKNLISFRKTNAINHSNAISQLSSYLDKI